MQSKSYENVIRKEVLAYVCEILKLVINYNFIKKQKLLKLLFMKRINLITITLLVTGVVIIAISAVSCKKDKLTEPYAHAQPYSRSIYP